MPDERAAGPERHDVTPSDPGGPEPRIEEVLTGSAEGPIEESPRVEPPSLSRRDAEYFNAAIDRLPRWMVLVVLAGMPLTWRFGGSTWLAGFLVGAAISYFNFIFWRMVVDRLTRVTAKADQGAAPAKGAKRRGTFRLWIVLRLGALALGCFAILRVSIVNLKAALVGLFVSLAAVVLEILYELTFVR